MTEAEEIIDEFECISDQLEIWKSHNWAREFKHRRVSTRRIDNCGRIFTGPLQVLVDGRIAVCCFDHDGKTALGSLREDTLKDIFLGQEFVHQVCMANTGNWDNKYPCKGCDQRNAVKDKVILYTTRDESDRLDRTSTSFSVVKKSEDPLVSCLKCGRRFVQSGRFNRVCSGCRIINANIGRFSSISQGRVER